ncbi:tau 95 subunit of transcription factor TFIIIC [Coemansia sp. RSA 1722]|nr:tau 95 subunit of transcription factor TFIIIC [Coemansia sp. RSA 485]KAJ2597574.1 tau 95 subunit of transcription factor TFIIIC [Coemansia sp. RSA 1722]
MKYKSHPEYAERSQIPQRTVLSVEYPGYIKDAEKAIRSLGGREKLARDVSEDTGARLELRYRYNDPTSHPISGEIVPTQNVLIKVTRRIKRAKGASKDKSTEISTETSAEIVGIIEKTARFRKLADFQYVVGKDDPLTGLTHALQDINLEEAKRVGSSSVFDSDVAAKTAYIPAPFLDRSCWPSQYLGKVSGQRQKQRSHSTDVDDIDKDANKHIAPYNMLYHGIQIRFNDKTVPSEPTPQLIEDMKVIPENILTKARAILEETPVVTRNAMDVMIPASERNSIKLNNIMSTMSYGMDTGPWRSCWIRFGYDPRKDKDSYKYQIFDQRRLVSSEATLKHRKGRTRGFPQSQMNTFSQGEAGLRYPAPVQKYILDEEAIRQDIAGIYQMQNIDLPLVNDLLEYPAGRRKTPCEKSGWFYPSILKTIRLKIREFKRAMEEAPNGGTSEIFVDYEALNRSLAEDYRQEEAELAAERVIKDREEGMLLGQTSQFVRDRVNAQVDELMRELGAEKQPGASSGDALAGIYDSDDAEFDVYGEESDELDSDDGFNM